jgi:hypothetical protein
MITREFILTRLTGRYKCPVCDGGSSGENSLNIWREGYYAMAKCHRASCDAFAKYPRYDGSSYTEKSAPAPYTEVLTPYTGYFFPLSYHPTILEAFKRRYGFTPTAGLGTDGSSSLIIPILSPQGIIRGHVFKRGLFPREQKYNGIYKCADAPMISWTEDSHPDLCPDLLPSVMLVEDQISALKFRASTGLRACALLGTNLTMQGVAEIQKHAEYVTIALDADATAKAFRLARKYGSAFKSCQVKILEKDIKDDESYNS